MSGRLKRIVKHRIWGLDKRVSCADNGWTIYTSYDVFLRKELPFRCCNYCTCSVKNFNGVNVLNRDQRVN